MTDWYLANLNTLVVLLACSLAMFIVTFACLSIRVQQKFIATAAESQKTADIPEVALIKAHTRTVRLLSVIGLVLQALLLFKISRLSTPSSTYFLTLVRPVVNACVFVLGFMTNAHAAFRLAFMLLQGHMIVLNTIAEVSFAMAISCMETEGLQCGDSALSLSIQDLKFLLRYELTNLFLSPWVTLETAYLCVAIGFCSSRYSARRLSLSRPTFNLRAAVLAHFPIHPDRRS